MSTLNQAFKIISNLYVNNGSDNSIFEYKITTSSVFLPKLQNNNKKLKC
jgi:hypothetical protein